MKINSWWSKNIQREKILILITVPLLLLIITQLLFIQPLEENKKNITIKIQSNGLELDQLNQQLETTQQLLAVSSRKKFENQQKSLKQQIMKQQQLLATLTENLIPPDKMAVVVEKLLKQRGKLKLISLANLEPEGLPDVDDKNNPAIESKRKQTQQKEIVKQHKPLIYRHPLVLKFKGSYFQILDYLKALENSEYSFYWEQLDYKVDRYPQAEVLLKLSTLGTESQWMGASINE